MKVKDESEWQAQLAEFAADSDPRAQVFHDFVIAWAEGAEALIDQNGGHLPIEALRDSLRATEVKVGRPPIGFIGMTLIVLATHWAAVYDIDEFFASMTTIEQNLFADVSVAKLADLEAKAEEVFEPHHYEMFKDPSDVAKARGEISNGDG
jgi:hypothetical protein